MNKIIVATSEEFKNITDKCESTKLIISPTNFGYKMGDFTNLFGELKSASVLNEGLKIYIYDFQLAHSKIQNMFLKILEETPNNIELIFHVTSLRMIVPTIISRTNIETIEVENKKMYGVDDWNDVTDVYLSSNVQEKEVFLNYYISNMSCVDAMKVSFIMVNIRRYGNSLLPLELIFEVWKRNDN